MKNLTFGPYFCSHLTEKDIDAISDFQVTRSEGKGLEYYLKDQALLDEESFQARTYLVRNIDTNELVAYFSLKAGFVAVNEQLREGNVFLTRFPEWSYPTLRSMLSIVESTPLSETWGSSSILTSSFRLLTQPVS